MPAFGGAWFHPLTPPALLCIITGMSYADITIEVPGTTIPTSFVRLLTYNDERRGFFSELTGPQSAFEFKEGARYDQVKVIAADQVTIKTLRAL